MAPIPIADSENSDKRGVLLLLGCLLLLLVEFVAAKLVLTSRCQCLDAIILLVNFFGRWSAVVPDGYERKAS